MKQEYLNNQRKITVENLKEMENKHIREAHKSRMKEALDFFDLYTDKKSRVLDIGCRNGDYLAMMRDRGYEFLMGVDCSEEAVKAAKENNSVSCFVEDAHYLTRFKEETFGTVLMSHIIEHCMNPIQVLEEVSRIMKTGGKLLIEIPLEPKPDNIPTKWGHWHTFQSDKDLFLLMESFPEFTCVDFRIDRKKNKWVRAVFKKVGKNNG